MRTHILNNRLLSHLHAEPECGFTPECWGCSRIVSSTAVWIKRLLCAGLHAEYYKLKMARYWKLKMAQDTAPHPGHDRLVGEVGFQGTSHKTTQ